MKRLIIAVSRDASADIPIRIESDLLIYKAITGMTRSAPLRVTAVDHGMPDFWRACLQNVSGSTEMNVAWDRLRDADLRRAEVVDADTVAFPGVNSAGWRAWTSGGQLAYYAPLDLSGYVSGELQILLDGETLLTLNDTDGTLEIDAATPAVWLRIAPATLSALDLGDYACTLRLTDAAGDVLLVCGPDSVFSITI
jgi:hypothetical protein